MKVGLLICGEMPSAMHRSGITYPKLIKDWLGKHMPAKTTYKAYRAFAGSLPPSVDSYDCYFVSGSRASLTDNEPWMRELCNFLLVAAKAQVPTVGLCFGHQALAQSLGGRVAKAKQWCAGFQEWRVIRDEGWMRDCGKRLRLLSIHGDQVVKLPPRSVRIATSEVCPNGVFRIANHTIGIQGHPEFSPEIVKKLIKANEAKIGAAKARAAIASLSEPTHNADMARWCASFVSTRA